MFKRKEPEPPPPPTAPVLVKGYDSMVTGKGGLTSALGGVDDKAIAGILAYYEADANALAQHGYVPVATAWANSLTRMRGPLLTVTYVKH